MRGRRPFYGKMPRASALQVQAFNVVPCALALGSVLVATALRLLLGDWLTEDPSVLFLAAICVTAWRGGTAAGIFAIALSALAQARFFIAPEVMFLATWREAAALAIWSIEAAFVCAIVGALRSARARAERGEQEVQHAHDALEDVVAARTAQLSAANEALRHEATERAATEARLRQTQKMDAIGRLAGGVAHDFNNVLSVILSLVSINLDDVPQGTLRDDLKELGKAAERAATLTRQLLLFSRQQTVEPKILDLRDALGEMDKMLERLVGEKIQLSIQRQSPLSSVCLDPGHVGQIVMNLAANARDAMPHGGTLTIELADVVLDEAHLREYPDARLGPHVVLTVRDTGVGMDRATRARIFEPFFTTKEVGKGTGLGLATVFGIVRGAGGSIGVTSELGVGTTFRIYVPAVQDARDVPARSERTPTIRGPETVLLVEDEEQVRRTARTILQRSGYRVLEACNGHEALRMCVEHASSIDVVVTDEAMPGMDGRELADRIDREWPQLPIVRMSGHIHNMPLDEARRAAPTTFLQKPFTPHALTRALRDVLESERVRWSLRASAGSPWATR